MKLNISILIAVIFICYIPECLGSGPVMKITIKGNVQVISHPDRPTLCTPVEKANIFILINRDEYTNLEGEYKLAVFSTDKNGDFKATIFYPRYSKSPCYYYRNGTYILDHDKCIEIPEKIEIIASYSHDIIRNRYRAKKLIYKTADLNMTQNKEEGLIFEIPMIDMTPEILGYRCDD